MDNQRQFVSEFEELLLLAILRLKTDAYGVTIRQTIEEAGRPTSIGAVYTTLERLEAKGFISSWQGDATPERGGRAKRFFQIEGAGITALNNTCTARSKLLDGLEGVSGIDWRPVGGMA